ncbi:hypothetical protein H4R19_005761 [Coemansia spiralis]|nr:hypothetical protein H4R19_005761 [Coemansia spiralis]
MKLSKKQQKALQFKGKLEKPKKEDRPAKRAADSSSDAAPGDAQAEQKTTGAAAGRSKKAKPPPRQTEKPDGDAKAVAPKASRFITFVGNLPFTTTAEELKTYMKAANPTSVRLMTNRETGKSRGFAFVEFSAAEDLRHGLQFHHCRLGGKKINVELTAGGGGNSDKRTEKIKRRREDLEKERSKESAAKRQRGDDQAEDAGGGAEADGSDDGGDIGAEDVGDHGGESADAKASKKINRRKRGRGSRK